MPCRPPGRLLEPVALKHLPNKFFSLLAANATAANSDARVRASRAHHARAVRSSKTTATAGVQVLLESNYSRVPLSARVPVTAWPRRGRVCLVLVTLEQLSNRGPVSCSGTYSFSCARVLLEQYAALQE